MVENSILWDRYPLVARHPLARSWLICEASYGRAPNTIDAYARAREDFFTFCAGRGIKPELATKEHVALWVGELTSRPHRRGANVKAIDSGAGLSNATLQQKVTAVRLFFDFLIEEGFRANNPVGRGRYTPGKGFAGHRDRALIPRYRKLPWIPGDDEWQAITGAVKTEPLRNRAMFLLCYDAALRRDELCSLGISDFDFSHQLVTVRFDVAKRRRERVVPFSDKTAGLLVRYVQHRRTLSIERGRLFLSESNRNRATPISYWSWSKIIEGVARRSGIERFTTHTLRHLRLTDLARSGWDIHEIATYAGHANSETTRCYIHLSGRDLSEKIRRGMDQIHKWRLSVTAKELG
ncbi:MAG TPA: tyrosine-type recombinase/integrase [Pyrinomonadaceae bacterium]